MKRNKGIKVERMELILLLDRNPPPETADKAGELFAEARRENALLCAQNTSCKLALAGKIRKCFPFFIWIERNHLLR